MYDPELFVPIYVLSDVWQHAGWNSIIYIAALSSIDSSIYESCYIDGASTWQIVRYIDLPCLVPTMMVLLILTMGSMECEIEHRNLSAAEARRYIAGKKQEYDRWLAYGSISTKEQRRIDKTFEYLSARYPADTSADELLTRITEVRSTVTEIADYTRHRQTEEVQRKEREAELLAQAEKRRAAQRSRTGFDPTPADFCPRLSDRQIAVLTEHINRGSFIN